MGAILSFLGTILAKYLGDGILKWIAFKAVMIIFFITVLPLILNNFMYAMIEIFQNLASGQAASAIALNGDMSFSGFAAWLLECFRIPEAFALMVSALCLRLVLNMIPFVRLVG